MRQLTKFRMTILGLLVLIPQQSFAADDWHPAHVRQWQLTYIKGDNLTPIRALFGGKLDSSNEAVEYRPVPVNKREYPEQVRESIRLSVPDFSIRINDTAQAFVRIDGEIKEVVIESGRYAYKPAQLTAAEFKKLPSLDKRSIANQEDALSEFITKFKEKVEVTEIDALPKEKRLWKEKSFKTCGVIKYYIVYAGTTIIKHEIELPDNSILRIPTYQIQSMRCTAQGRMTVLLAYVEGGRPVEVRQSLLMLDTGIDFSAHEKASQTK
jgi:hypothetical protein